MIFFGQKGLLKYFSLQNEIQGQEIFKKELENQVEYKKTKIHGMSPNSLDLDLLDEEARKNLGYSSKNEVIIYQDNKKKNAK
jgi:cell division protein FtsB